MKPCNREALSLLNRRGSLTESEYRDEAHRQRLAARVYELRTIHHVPIAEHRERGPNGSHYSRYSLPVPWLIA